MGKKAFKGNRDTSANASANAGIILSAFEDTPTADHFALITHAVDRHRLRIFNVRSGTVSNDYSAEEKERFTCLTWGHIKDTGDIQTNTVQAFKKKKAGAVLSKVIALGTHSGSIHMFSLSHGSIVKKLSQAHTTPVLDFVVTKTGSRGYSIAEDNYIVEWDIDEGKELHKWKADAKNVQKLKLSHDESKLVTAGHTLTLWDLTSKTIIKKFTGHASAVKELAFSQQDDVLVSIAEDDRYVNVWDAQSSNTNSNNLTALTLENNVAHVNFSSTEPSVLAVTEDGLVGIWENASSISQASGGSSRRKMMRSMTKEADATLKIVSTVSQDTIIPVLAAKFVADNAGKSIMIARGSSIKPSFEVVKYVNDENGAILRDIELTRQPITNYLIDDGSVAASNLRTTRKAYDESKVTVIGNTDFAVKTPTMAATTETQDDSNAEPSIEQRLKEMGVGENTTSKARKSKKKTIATPAAGSLQNVLVQALHSHDKQLLEACLEHTKLDVIHGTVKRLPTQYLIPLLTELISKFQEKPGRASSLLDWIKAVLTIHTAYLMTVPDLVGKLSSFYQALDTRYSVFPKLLALSGRLDIVQNQINVRSYSTLNQDELEMAHHAENVYVELDSDDEDEAEELMSIHGGDDMMDTSDEDMDEDMESGSEEDDEEDED